MQLVSISPGNYNTGRTFLNEKFSPWNNLRFQFKCEDMFYEMAIKNVNSTTINLVGSHKRKRDGSNIKCLAKCTLYALRFILAECLQTVVKESSAKKKKFQ